MILATWFTLNIIDFILTWVALSWGAVEANNILVSLGVDDVPALAGWKAGISVFGILFFRAVNLSRGGYYLALAGMTGICLWNVFVLLVLL